MGTSVSQMSPRSRGWSIVQAAYSSDRISVERAVVEIWRAATSETANLAVQLSSPVIERIDQIAVSAKTSMDVAMQVELEIANSDHSNFACELARLAAIKAAQVPIENRQTVFREKLFMEASNYFVSRDISGFVGDSFRNKDVSQMIEFKRKTMEQTSEVVRKSAVKLKEAASWTEYITVVVENLRGRPSR